MADLVPARNSMNMPISAATNTSVEQTDAFWTHAEIDAVRWNQVFTYQLMLVKQTKDGDYVIDSDTKKWSFVLPFPPESLSITMPFAIAGNVTQGGYIEEHGGAPIRMLTLSGTLGVLPLRGRAPSRPAANLGQAIFGGTIQQAQRVAQSARQFASAVTGSNVAFKDNLVDDSVFQNPDNDPTYTGKTSGYYQFRKLQEFFENYVAFKKTAKGKDYRLAFAIYKQQAIYLVTPTSFTVSQSASSPLEYVYSLQLRAFRRVNFDIAKSVGALAPYTPAVRRPNALASMLSAISDARDILENSRDILAAVGGDLDHALFEPLRQLSLFAKDALSVPLAFSDLPIQVLNDCQSAVVEYVSTQQALSGASDTFRQKSQAVADAYKALANLGASTSKVETGVGLLQQASYSSDPALDVFRNPQDNYDFFKNLAPGKINLPPTTIKQIQAQRLAVRSLTRLDFENMRDTANGVMADFADAVGAGNATFNTTYQRAARTTSKQPTPSDFKVLFALNRVVMEMNRLAASGETNRTTLSSVDYVAGLAQRSGIAFRVPKSKFAIPFPYGNTLEQLATRYLGDPDRWLEIAALNGLRTPYVDELGFDLLLSTDGSGNQVVVADASNLFVGQQVWISSATKARTSRHITKIDVLNTTTAIITVDGDSDLGGFSTLAGAVLHAFLPGTVNSMMTIYIPSDADPANVDYLTKAIPGLDVFDQLLAVGGVDLLLTATNDLAITPDGDCRLAVGLANIIQTARIRLSVTQGSLNRHPSFGLPIKIGMSIADLDATALLKAVENLFNDDPTFTGVTSASVSIAGPATTIGFTLQVRGQSQLIPVTMNVVR